MTPGMAQYKRLCVCGIRTYTQVHTYIPGYYQHEDYYLVLGIGQGDGTVDIAQGLVSCTVSTYLHYMYIIKLRYWA